MIMGYLQSSIIAAAAFLLSGWYGVLMFFGIAMFAKFFLESVNPHETKYCFVCPIDVWNLFARIEQQNHYSKRRHLSGQLLVPPVATDLLMSL